jgi:hypothetical protein
MPNTLLQLDRAAEYCLHRPCRVRSLLATWPSSGFCGAVLSVHRREPVDPLGRPWEQPRLDPHHVDGVVGA